MISDSKILLSISNIVLSCKLKNLSHLSSGRGEVVAQLWAVSAL